MQKRKPGQPHKGWKSAAAAQARRAHDVQRKGRAARDPAVRALLDRFPGAEITDVRLDGTGEGET